MNEEQIGAILRGISNEIERQLEDVDKPYMIGITCKSINKEKETLFLNYQGFLTKWNLQRNDFDNNISESEAKKAVVEILSSVNLKKYDVSPEIISIKKQETDWFVVINVEVKNR